MDKISRKILAKIIASNNKTIPTSGIDNPFYDIADIGLVKSSLDYLEKNSYITITRGICSEISASYRALHPVRYQFENLFSYLIKNWIAIAALVISLISLLKQ